MSEEEIERQEAERERRKKDHAEHNRTFVLAHPPPIVDRDPGDEDSNSDTIIMWFGGKPRRPLRNCL